MKRQTNYKDNNINKRF